MTRPGLDRNFARDSNEAETGTGKVK